MGSGTGTGLWAVSMVPLPVAIGPTAVRPSPSSTTQCRSHGVPGWSRAPTSEKRTSSTGTPETAVSASARRRNRRVVAHDVREAGRGSPPRPGGAGLLRRADPDGDRGVPARRTTPDTVRRWQARFAESAMGAWG